jgi:ADP-heptose:LPS heptosyltransferase
VSSESSSESSAPPLLQLVNPVIKAALEPGPTIVPDPKPEPVKNGPLRLQGLPAGKAIFNYTKTMPVKLLIQQHQSPGDILMLTAAIRDLHQQYPQKFVTDVRTSADALFENSPYITKLDDKDPDLFIIKAEYPLVHDCNEGPWHFVESFHQDFENKLGIRVKPRFMRGDIHISAAEKSWFSQIYEILGRDVPYWIIDAGCKSDYTNKQWEVTRYQEVVDRLPEIWFVQVGLSEHRHTELEGDNVVNLIDKTDMRQFVRLMYHAAGVLTPVSFPMHLAAAVEMKSVYKRKTRPCIVIAGGREPNQWEAYANHQYLHTCGQLSCCDNGGCWKSRVEPLNDGEEHDKSLCDFPVDSTSGKVPKCMDMITADEVVGHVRRYMEEWNYYLDWDKK